LRQGYYRRGDAQFALGRFKEALIDLKKVDFSASIESRIGNPQAAQVAPRDPDLRRKLSLCEKAYKRQKFEEAVAVEVLLYLPGSLCDPSIRSSSRNPSLRP